MLYLEDYLEMIEHLPQELRDRFTDMREMDLSVQNNIDAVEKRIRLLFSQCARGELQGGQADVEFNGVRKEYYKILEDADEKVQLANLMYDLVDRYLRRLDSELFKFKCELEADHNGITEILEKRSLELDGGTTIPMLNAGSGSGNASSGSVSTGIGVASSAVSGGGSQKENRFFGMISNNNHSQNRDRYHRSKPEKRRNSSTGSNAPPEKRPAIANHVSVPSTPINVIPPPSPAISLAPPTPTVLPPSLGFNVAHLNNSNAVSSPSTPIISNMKHVNPNRRTTSNLSSTFDSIHGTPNTVSHDLLLSRDVATNSLPSGPLTPSADRDNNPFNQRRHKKKPTSLNMPPNHSSTILSAVNLSGPSNTPPIMQSMDSNSPSVVLNDAGLVVEQTADGEWTYDPNEPRYCICNQVSYGDMVACDNEACPFEWFHYPCVGITQSPKGKWYCPKCTASMKRRGPRK